MMELELIKDWLSKWKSKGELCYLARKGGMSWVEISDLGVSGPVALARNWALKEGLEWPVGSGHFPNGPLTSSDALGDRERSFKGMIDYGHRSCETSVNAKVSMQEDGELGFEPMEDGDWGA